MAAEGGAPEQGSAEAVLELKEAIGAAGGSISDVAMLHADPSLGACGLYCPILVQNNKTVLDAFTIAPRSAQASVLLLRHVLRRERLLLVSRLTLA